VIKGLTFGSRLVPLDRRRFKIWFKFADESLKRRISGDKKMLSEPPEVRLNLQAGGQREEDLLLNFFRDVTWGRQRREATSDVA
jgi:hypothetical protein